MSTERPRLSILDEEDGPPDPPASARPRFGLVPLDSISMTAPEWTVKGILERDTLSCLFGPPSSGKSFKAIGIAAAVARGEPWQGRRVRQGAVAYLAGEGRLGIRKRFLADGIIHGDLTGAPIAISTGAVPLADSMQAAQVCQAIERTRGEFGPLELVVIDTLSRHLGGDENSSLDMSALVQGLDWIRAAADGAAILIVHHSGLAATERARGSSVLNAALDWSWRVERGEDRLVRAFCTKSKDHELPDPLAFELRPVDLPDPTQPGKPWRDEDGQAITSAVLHEVGFEPAVKQGKAGRGRWQTEALDALTELCTEHRDRLARGGFAEDQAHVRITDWRERMESRGIPKSRRYALPGELERAGRIRLEGGCYAFPQ